LIYYTLELAGCERDFGKNSLVIEKLFESRFYLAKYTINGLSKVVNLIRPR